MKLRKPKYSNELTKEIDKGNMSLEDLLMHEDLSLTIRNEAESYLNYFFPPKEMESSNPNPNLPKLDELIKLALEPDPEQQNKYHLYQLSRNASNVLSSTSDRLYDKLKKDNSRRYFKALRQFIYNSDFKRKPMFAGHFQRMFEASLRIAGDALLGKDSKFQYDDEFTESSFITCLIQNSELMPYRELLSVIISEFFDQFPKSIDEVARYAAIGILKYNETQVSLFSKCECTVIDQKKVEEREKKIKFLRKVQPKNCKLEPIPIPFYLSNNNISYTPLFGINADDEFYNDLKKVLKFSEVTKEDIFHPTEICGDRFYLDKWRQFSLNLIYVLENAYENDFEESIQNYVDKDVKAGHDSNLVRCLLVCGVFADHESPLSYESFSLLFNLLNERHTDKDGRYDDKFIINLSPPPLVDQFAERFMFDPFLPSETMISALLVFWNHRYEEVNFSPFIKNKSEEQILPNYKQKKGVSALELLLPAILTEPVYSTRLVNIFMRIITSLEQEIIDAHNRSKRVKKSDVKNDNDSESDQRCFEIDSIWYELLRYEFRLIPSMDEECITLIQALEKLLPLPTTDSFYHEDDDRDEKPQLFRAVTNPVFFVLSNIINHGAFFSYKDGLLFREKLFTKMFEKTWAFQSFIYYHIIEKMKKNLIFLSYHPKRRLSVDEYDQDPSILEEQEDHNEMKMKKRLRLRLVGKGK